MSGRWHQEKYEKFMDEYHSKHLACPKCGSLAYSSTLMGYIVDWNNPDGYKDLNRCNCVDCKHVHTIHDRVSKAEIRDEKLKDLGI